MKYVEIVFAATVVGALVGCAGQPAALDPNAKAVTPAPLALKVWPGSDNAVQFANEKPLQFSADATAAEKIFSVLGMPSFQAVRAGAFSIQAVQKTSAEQTQQNISSVARQAPANRNAAELAAFNALARMSVLRAWRSPSLGATLSTRERRSVPSFASSPSPVRRMLRPLYRAAGTSC